MTKLKTHQSSGHANTKQDYVGCFGKLPLKDEYVRVNMSRGWVSQLDQWTQKTFTALRQEAKVNADLDWSQLGPYHFVMTGSDGHQTVIGSWKMSQDKSGRHYPFVTFRQIHNSVAEEFNGAIPLLYDGFFQESMAFYQQDWRVGDEVKLEQVINQLGKSSLTMSKRFSLDKIVNCLHQISLKELSAAVVEEYRDSSLEQLMQSVAEAFWHLKAKKQVEKNVGIRLPIFRGKLSTVLLVFWLQLYEISMPMQNKRLQVLWQPQTGSKQAEVFLFPRPLGTEEFLAVTTKQYAGNVIDLEVVMNQPRGVLPELSEMLTNSNSLLELVNRWHGIKRMSHVTAL